MCINILKKDLKRKKTMNIILLIFIIIATMFVSSSVNNIISVSSALDNYFSKAGMSDYFIVTKKVNGKDGDVGEILDKSDFVDNYRTENVTYVNADQIKPDKMASTSTTILMPVTESKINYFNKDNEIISNVNDGEVYISQKSLEKSGVSTGDTVEVTIGDEVIKVKIAGGFKDAFLGADMMGITRMLLSDSDYNTLISDDEADLLGGKIFYIDTDDIKQLEDDMSDVNGSILFMGDKDMVSLSYVMDMVIAGCLLVVSVCLILIAFVVLRFTITFTLDEEYREIGVMKAIGIRNVKIRGIYLVKYLVLSLVGAVIGLSGGIPFGNMLLKSVSTAIVMENSSGYIINLMCALLVIAVIMLFCFMCTRKIKKFTPIDAIRNGSNGERYKRKNIVALNKSKARPSLFMAVNDILCNAKRYVIMMITFIIGFILIAVIINTMNTLKSDKLVTWFAMTPSDVYMIKESEVMTYFADDGREKEETRISEIEKELKDNNIPAKCYIDNIMKLTIRNGDAKCKSIVLQGTGTTTDEYAYTEGTPPQNEHEVAITKLIAEKIDVKIGDTIIMSHLSGDKEYIITAFFQTMNNMGEGVRIHESAKADYEQLMMAMDFQIRYTDNPDKDQKEERFEKIKDIYSDYTVSDGGEYVDKLIGGISGSMKNIRTIVIIIVLVICSLVAILMERSFIARETGEIATMKAIGFRDVVIVWIHTLRLGIVMVISTVIAVLLSTPVSEITAGQVFKMMGAEYIDFDVNPLEIFVEYPLIMLAVALIAVFFTAQYTRKILASQTANVE